MEKARKEQGCFWGDWVQPKWSCASTWHFSFTCQKWVPSENVQISNPSTRSSDPLRPISFRQMGWALTHIALKPSPPWPFSHYLNRLGLDRIWPTSFVIRKPQEQSHAKRHGKILRGLKKHACIHGRGTHKLNSTRMCNKWVRASRAG